MSAQRHVIKRQVIELTVQRPEEAREYQETLSRIYRERVVPWMERHFDEISGPERLQRIDFLDLDLGVLDPDTLEEDFVSRVEALLTAKLAARIEAEEVGSERDENASQGQSQLELFALFVRTGSLPWWADASRPGVLVENLEQLLARSPKALGALLPELVREPGYRLRLIQNYSDGQLEALCAVLLPDYAEELERDLGELFSLWQSPAPTADGRASTRLRKSIWHTLLWVAGMGGRQYVRLADFYRAVFRRLDPQIGRLLLTGLQQALLAREDNAELAGDLLAELQKAVGVDGISAEPQEMLPGGLPEAAQMEGTGAEQEEVLPGDLPQADQVRKAMTAGRKARRGKEITRPRLPGEETSNPEEEYAPAAPGKKSIDLGFSETDEILVGNSGLAILWPFLGHFFTRLGLMDEDRRFINPSARQRAAGLLQVLATQDTSPPEYLLALNKILCGLTLTEVFEFGAPLLENEGQECAGLLAAVIAQVPILNNMTADGFRGTFLLRPGILSIRDGMWLLRVERQTYDVVLDRFPWGWEWVKLSWMEAPLRVEW